MFQDEHPEKAESVRRGPGRPKGNHAPVVTLSAPAPVKASGYNHDKRYRITKHDVDGGHQGPVPLHVGGTRNGKPHDERAMLIPEVPVVISATLYHESLRRTVIDERGPDFDRNQAAIARGEATPQTLYDKDGRVVRPGGHATGNVKRRFQYDVEEV